MRVLLICLICQALKTKIFRFTGIPIYGIYPAVPRPHEGRFAIVTARRAQDAMDAAISGVAACFRKEHGGRRTRGRRGRRSRVVLAPRPWRYVGESFSLTTGARKAASPGRARISRKTIARGKPGCFGCTCLTRVHSFAILAHGAAGAVGARLSLRPHFKREGQRDGTTRASQVAGMSALTLMLRHG